MDITVQDVSFVMPSRNNLRFLQWSYNSIRENIGNDVCICVADDASTDGTWNWLNTQMKSDAKLKIIRNNGPDRVGHTVLYDRIINELVTTKCFVISHADMYWSPNSLINIIKHLKQKTVVAGTRVEPELHPPGPEKHIRNFGMDTNEFQVDNFLKEVSMLETINKDKATPGIFAPWAMYKEDFIAIGGHDILFAPMELEDSDIFNRMFLAGYELIQSRDAFVYHMTCRGSRFKDGLEIEQVIDLPDGTKWYKPKDSAEYLELRNIKFREWWRKWGQNVLHDENMMPIVQPKYDIGFVIKNCRFNDLKILEPWCNVVYTDLNWDTVREVYIRSEQKTTLYDLYERIFPYDNEKQTEIIVEFDMLKFTAEDFNIIQNLSAIIKDSGEIGTFEISNLKITIINMNEFQGELIKCTNNVFKGE